MNVNWKDPKVLAGLGVGALALWFFFLRTPTAQQAAQKSSSTTASDQGTAAPAYTTGGDPSGQGGGSAGAVDLSGIIDSILSANTATHAYDLSYLSSLQQSNLAFLGGFSANFLGFAADVTDRSLDSNLALTQRLLDSTVPLGPSGGGSTITPIPVVPNLTPFVPSSTNPPVQLPQPRGTSPGRAPSPRVSAPFAAGAALGAALGTAPQVSVPHSAPVVPAVHQQGGVHGPAMD